MTSLAEIPIGTDAVIRSLPTGGGVFLRLREMGVLPGTRVKLLRTAPLGDPLEIQVRGYNLSLRRAEAASVGVEQV
jgi:ferrous iron transport protein A